MTFETIVAWLGAVSLLPWRAGTSLFLTFAASILAYFTSNDSWAWCIFVLAVVLGFWSYVETKAGCVIATLLPFICAYWATGLDTSIRLLNETPHGCVTIQGKSAEECQKLYEMKNGNVTPPA